MLPNAITGKGNQVDLNGMYYTLPESRFDMNLNIVNLGMKSIEGFSFGAIKNSSGNITGGAKNNRDHHRTCRTGQYQF
jgi:hypothetical protein